MSRRKDPVFKMIPLEKLREGPVRGPLLPTDAERVRRIYEVFGSLEPECESLEVWIEDFTRDLHPEKEIAIWENMVVVFEAFLTERPEVRGWGTAALLEVYGVVLACTAYLPEQIRKQHPGVWLKSNHVARICDLYRERRAP